MSTHSLVSRALSAATLALALTVSLSACNGGASSGGDASGSGFTASDGTSGPLPGRKYSTDVLIYDGVGAAFNDADSLEAIVTSHGLKVDRATSAEFNKMSVDDLAQYGVIVWPGGYATQMTNSLTRDARARIREAVVERGVSFMGICAGAWMTIGPKPAAGQGAEWGLALVPGEVMDEWFPSGTDGIEMTPVTIAGQSQPRDIVWWGGPKLPEWPGGTIARYKDGTPAMSQTWSGHGFVVISSPHPEAPDVWRDQYSLNDSDGTDFDLAYALIQGALNQTSLATF